jgi:hypothetical protein
MSADLWCAGWRRAGHHTDLLVDTNAGIPLCQGCVLAWLRADRKDRTDA